MYRNRISVFFIALLLLINQFIIPPTVVHASSYVGDVLDWLASAAFTATKTAMGNKIISTADQRFVAGGGKSHGGGASRSAPVMQQWRYNRDKAREAVRNVWDGLDATERNRINHLYNTNRDTNTVIAPDAFDISPFSRVIHNRDIIDVGRSPNAQIESGISFRNEYIHFSDLAASVGDHSFWPFPDEAYDDDIRQRLNDSLLHGSGGIQSHHLTLLNAQQHRYIYFVSGFTSPNNPNCYAYIFSHEDRRFYFRYVGAGPGFAMMASLTSNENRGNYAADMVGRGATRFRGDINGAPHSVVDGRTFYTLEVRSEATLGFGFNPSADVVRYFIDYSVVSVKGDRFYDYVIDTVMDDLFTDDIDIYDFDLLEDYMPREVFFPAEGVEPNYDTTEDNDFTTIINNYIDNSTYYGGDTINNITYITNIYHPDEPEPTPSPSPEPTPPPVGGGDDDGGTNIWDFLIELIDRVFGLLERILDYLNPFSDNFFLKVALIPEEGYFDSHIESLREKVESRIPLFGQMFEVVDQLTAVLETNDSAVSSYSAYARGSPLTLEITLPERYGGVSVPVIDFSYFDAYRSFVHGFIILSSSILLLFKIIRRIRTYL